MKKTDTEEIVLYLPPKSTGYGHVARRKDKHKAWSEFQMFLKYFDSVVERDARLTVYGNRNNNQYYNEVFSQFNEPNDSFENTSIWEIPTDLLPIAIEISLKERPKNQENTIDLHLNYSLKWKKLNPSQKIIPPYLFNPKRKFHSDIGVSITHNVFFQPKLMFPFSYQEKNLHIFINELQINSPFKFRDNYFKRIFKLKNKSGYRSKKLEKGWLT